MDSNFCMINFIYIYYKLFLTTLFKGVAQVLNRLDGKPFDDADQRLFEVRSTSFCGNRLFYQHKFCAPTVQIAIVLLPHQLVVSQQS